MKKKCGRATSIYLMQTNPLAGIWISPRNYESIQLGQRWKVMDDGIVWEPTRPLDADYREQTIQKLISISQIDASNGAKSYLKLSGTTKTGVTWSLPPVKSCPILDETCGNCYALDGWYRTNLLAQYGRVKRYEYLQNLIKTGGLDEWIIWISKKINRLKPVEKLPRHAVDFLLNKHLKSRSISGPVAYFRWHDSGDVFHEEYAKALFDVCERTPNVVHWLPTRMGPLFAKLASDGVSFPANLAIQLSAYRGGANEAQQLEAIAKISQKNSTARVGLTYISHGPNSRQVNEPQIHKEFGARATVCPATIAKDSKNRTCVNCRRCWAHTSIQSPVIYAVHRGD